MAHPIIALDYVERGLIVKPMSITIEFTGLLVFRPGVPLSENAKQLLKVMRIQIDRDIKQLKKVLAGKKR